MLSVYSEEDNFSDTDKTIVYFVLAYAKTYKTHFELLKVCSRWWWQHPQRLHKYFQQLCTSTIMQEWHDVDGSMGTRLGNKMSQ